MLWKKTLFRGAVGIPIGISISYGITVITSLIFGSGAFSPVVPAFQEAVGSQSAAVGVQFLLTALMGLVFGAATCIWEVERWSITVQTLVHLTVISLGMLPAAVICRWAEYLPGGILGYFGIFAIIYIIIWVSITLSAKKFCNSANRKLQKG